MAVKFRDRDGSWFYRFNLDKVPYQKYGFPTHAEAKAAERKAIKEVESGKKAVSVNVRSATFAEAAKSFYDSYGHTLEHEADYRTRLPVICACPSMKKRLIDLTRQDIRDMRAYVAANVEGKPAYVAGQSVRTAVSVRTINHYHAHVRAVINWWIKENELSIVNVAQFVELETVADGQVRWLYPAEEKLLTPAVQAHPWLWPYYLTALETGLREGNLCSILVKHVNLALGQIFVPLSKNGRSGTLPISDRLRPWMEAWVKGKGPEDPVLGGYADNSVSNAFTALVRTVGLPGFTFHCLRHTFATHLLLRGEPIEHVSKLLFHRDVRVTQRHYDGVQAIHLRGVVNGGLGVVSGSLTPEITPGDSGGASALSEMPQNHAVSV